MTTLLEEFKRRVDEAISDAREIARATSYHNISKTLRFGRSCDTSVFAEQRANYVTRAEVMVLKACQPEILRLASALAIESIGLTKKGAGR